MTSPAGVAASSSPCFTWAQKAELGGSLPSNILSVVLQNI